MDEETKKIIADLCSSVGTMKAEIATLKSGATNSGVNPAGSQDSDLVPGKNPSSKRRKTVSEETDSEEDPEEETFVDLRGTGGNGGSTKLVEMLEAAAAFIQWRSQTFPDGGAQSFYRTLSMITHKHAGSYVHLLKVVVCMENA